MQVELVIYIYILNLPSTYCLIIDDKMYCWFLFAKVYFSWLNKKMANLLYIFCLNCCFSTLWVLKLSSANTDRRYHRLNDHAEWKSYLKRQLFVKLALQVVKNNRRKVNRLSVVVSSRQTLSSFQDIWPEVTSFTSCFKYLQKEEKKKKESERDIRGHLSGLAGNLSSRKGSWLRSVSS